MTRPTEGEIRAEPAGRRLDAWVHMHVMGKNAIWVAEEESVIEKNDKSPFGFTCNFGGAVFTADREWLVNDWYDPDSDREVPHYSADPTAYAELKRHLYASGEFARIECETCIGTTVGPFVCVVLVPRDGDMDKLISSNEDIATDPIAAECVAWCRAALIAALNR